MNILVTGGAGFVGSHLVDKLIEDEKNDIYVYDNLEPQVHNGKLPSYLNSNAKFITGDIRDKSKLSNLICDQTIDIIFHQAAIVGVAQSMYQIEKYIDVNTVGTANLLDILSTQEHNVKKLIVASSVSVYGEGAYECSDCGVVYPYHRTINQLDNKIWELKCPICDEIVEPIATNEEKPLRPASIYAISKRDQEEMCLSIGKMFGISTVALRYFNIYGPRQSLSNPYTGICAIFSSRIKNNNPPIIFEDGFQTRDFVSVHDIVKANLLVMESSRANYETYNVGSGDAISILDIANYLIESYRCEYNKDIKATILNKYRKGDIRHCFSDISKIKRLGYETTTSFHIGMKEFVKWGEKEIAIDKSNIAYRELTEKGII